MNAPAASPMTAPSAVPGPLADADLELLLTIRHFERRLLELFSKGKLKGTTHTCLGQEAVPVALMACLIEDDYVFSNHRGHGHFIARHRDPKALLAEIMGKEGAPCRGVGGSQHIHHRRFLTTGVQGGLLPVAAGMAACLNRARSPGIAVAFTGDGTWGEGIVYETLNLAQLWTLPLLVVVENNHIAMSTPERLHLAGTIGGRAEGFGVAHLEVHSQDVGEIRRMVSGPVARMRETRQPLVIELHTQRLGPHSKGDDTRPPEVLAELEGRDWYRRYADVDGEQLARLEARVIQELDRIVDEVERAAPSRVEAP